MIQRNTNNGRRRVTRLTSHPLTKCLLLFMPKNSDLARRAKSRNEPNPPPAQAAYKLKPAAAYLGGLSVPTMHRLMQRGLLRPNRATRHLLFLRSDLDAFLRDGVT